MSGLNLKSDAQAWSEFCAQAVCDMRSAPTLGVQAPTPEPEMRM